MSVPVKSPPQGMPPIITRDRSKAEKIIRAIRKGSTTKMAAAIGGISRRTLYEWIYKGREIRELREENPAGQLTPYDEDYLWFLTNYELAEIERKTELLRRIEESGKDPKRWQANAWLLERLHPDEFSLRHSVRLEDTGDKEVFTLSFGSPPKQIQEADWSIVEEEEDGGDA